MPDARPPRLAVLGSTGRVGRLVVADALRRGADVTVLVRDAARLAPAITADSRVTVVTGELDDPGPRRRALAGADAVIVAAGVRYRKGHPWSRIEGRVDVAPAAVRAALEARPARVVLLSAYGVGDSWRRLPALVRLVLRTSSLPAAYAALGEAEDLLAGADVPSTVVRAVTLVDTPASGQDVDTVVVRGNPSVSRLDVARWLLDAALSPVGVGWQVIVGA